MSENLEKLKRKRTSLRASTTKLINTVQDKLSGEITEELVTELKDSYELLNEKKNNLKALDDEVQNQLEVDLIDEDFNTSEEYNEKCIITCSRIKRFLNENSAGRVVQNISNLNQSNEIETFRNLGFNDNKPLKLPKLTIEKFWGDPKNWNEFWNSFESSIDRNDKLSKIEKFVYLKSFLAGQASNVVLGFELTEKNYDNCVALLKERYGRKDLIINSFMNKILNLESVKNVSNVKALRKLFDELDISIRNLEALEVTAGSYGHLLIPILLKLIPEELVLEFHRRKESKDKVEVSELIQFIKTEIECREASNLIVNERKKIVSTRFENPKFETNKFAKNTPTAAFHTSAFGKCIFCNSLHDWYKCEIDVNEKLKKLRSENRCFACFKKFHISRKCRNKIACKKCGSLSHHESICVNKKSPANSNANENTAERESERRSNASLNSDDINKVQNLKIIASQCNNNIANSENVLLQTGTVYACSNSNYKLTRVMFDQGSHRSFLTKRLADYLNLTPIRFEELSIFSFGAKKPMRESFPVVKVELQNKNNNDKIEIECLVSEIISVAPLLMPDIDTQREFERLGLQVADAIEGGKANNLEVQVLIGADYFWDCVYVERIKITKSLYAINSKFGWLAAGKEKSGKNKINKYCSQNLITINKAVIMNDLSVFWELDSLGINDCDEYSNVDTEIIDRFERNLEFRNGRYETKLLWKNTLDNLGDNFEIAKKRFVSLQNKLRKTPEICHQYKEIIESQLLEGIVEECPNDDMKSGYYMPHRAVVRPSETTAVRIVYDASCKADNTNSLNDCLESGPNLNPNILDIMLKFRKFKVAFSGDIEKAFLMIGIAENDRKFLKFLWFGKNTEQFKIMHMCRVAFGLTISPFILAATIKYHIRKYKEKMPDCFEMLNTSLYVDDLYNSVETAEDAYRLTVNTIKIFKEAGMNFRKLKTNSVVLNDLWVKNGIKEEDSNLSAEQNFLGMIWNSIEDRIKINLTTILEGIAKDKGNTKRRLLQLIAQIYDPMGLLSPFIVRSKLILQDIWTIKYDWDEVLPAEILNKWNAWCEELPALAVLSIKRNYFHYEAPKISLHIFADASPKAYGAIAYFRYFINEHEIKVSFILSKNRVAPLKALTLPRLELLGALVAARLYKYLKKVFKDLIKEAYLWTDSSIVITWIRGSPNNWKPFVCNRVAEIQKISNSEHWYHCEGKQNPADLLTRGISASSLVNSNLWWHGPHWLSSPAECFPKTEPITPKSDLLELKKNVVLTVPVSKADAQIVNIDKFSSLSKLLRVTAWVFRFISKLLKKPTQIGPLSVCEIKSAETYWVKITQEQFFLDEIHKLSSETSISSSFIYSLNPMLDDNNILRLKGRIQFAEFDEKMKHPILLPSKSKFTQLIILDAHEKVFHAGVSATLTQIRETYWIIKGRQRIKSVIGKCVICKRYSVRSGKQDAAPLPRDRIQESPPFSVTGLDYAGPFYTKDSGKVYLLLFTCAVTRALHVELVNNLSTESFLLAFRRFISRRGLCNIIYSDNALTFKKGDIELKRIWKTISDPSVKDLFSTRGIEWKYIIERGPWWGGFWERLVRTIKSSLRKVIGRSSLSLCELETVLIEIEAMINSRPITYVYNDPDEPSPLTPSHFLVGKRLLSLPSNKISQGDISGSRNLIIKRYKHHQNVLQQFWRRWRKEYLLSLRSANICPPDSNGSPFKINDIVLIHDDKRPRNIWTMGKILELMPGRDGKVRSCLIKTATGTLKRPVQLLYNLEINDV